MVLALPVKNVVFVENVSDDFRSLTSFESSKLVQVTDCSRGSVKVSGKAAKIIIQGCTDTKITVNCSLLAGTIECVRCKNLTVEVKRQVPTIAIDMCYGVNLLCSDLRHVFTTSSQNVVVTQEAGSHSPIKYSISDAETGLQSNKNVQNGQFVTYLECAPLPGNAGNSFVTELVHREGRGYLNYPTAWHKPRETISGNRPNGAASRDAETDFESDSSHATSLSLDGVTNKSKIPREGRASQICAGTPLCTTLLADHTSSTSCDEVEFTEVESFGAPQSYRSPLVQVNQGDVVQPFVQGTAESTVKGDMQCVDVDESYNTLRGEWQKVDYKPVQSQVNDAPVSWGLCIPALKPKNTFQSPIRRTLTINPQ